jgi:hypothetical protein
MNLLQLDYLRSVYSGVILACGASSDISLNIPGNNGIGIIEDITYDNIRIEQALWWTIWIGPE